LLFGILAAGLLIRRIWRDQEAFTRVETANQVMEHELHIASNIQMGILREGLRSRVKGEPWPDVALQATLVPMREVGGDLYDFFRKGDDLFFVIGDVSGKSVTAAMLMSATVNLFRSAVRRLQSPKVIMEEMNAVLSENNPSLMFVTAFIGRLHVPTGELLYCNAGHLPPLKVSGQQSAVSMLALQPNIPLGYDGKYRFIEQGTMLAQDEMVVLYTDGITEARNENREMLGMQRWVEIVKNNLQALIDGNMLAIREAGMRFTGEAEQADDMTLMIIRKTGDAQPLNIRVENRIDQWPVLRAALHNYGVCAGMDTRSLKKMEMALEEAVVNIVNYSQAEYIDLTITSRQTADERRFAVQLTDNGVPFDPTARPDTDTAQLANDRQIGGLGIALLKQIADEVHYSRIDDRNELILIKKI
ncbi:MAG: SpoIIE family protein phosphatase, partial [Paludibacteraceae bacterium]|nr:SpoIIE family protein phosphatase [Paludibacteraceae bacterium]